MSLSKLATRAMTHVIRSNHRHRTRGASLEATTENDTPFLENHRRTRELLVFFKRHGKSQIPNMVKWLANCVTVYGVQHLLFSRSKEKQSSEAMKELTHIAHEAKYLGVSNLAKLDAMTLDMKAANDDIKAVIKAVSDDIKAVNHDVKAVSDDVKSIYGALKKHDR